MRNLRMTKQPAKKTEITEEVPEQTPPKKEEDKSALLQALLSEEDDFYAFTLVGDTEEKSCNEVVSTLISMHHTIVKKMEARLEEQIIEKTAEMQEEAEEEGAQIVIEQEPPPDIKMYISTSGGAADDMFAMYDVMKWVQRSVDISTIGIGKVMSAGVPLLAAGTKGKRYSLPGAHTMIHQTLGGAEGQATDIEIYAKQMVKMKHDYARLIAEQSDKPFEEVLKDIERDNWMSAQETKDYGIIDNILESSKK